MGSGYISSHKHIHLTFKSKDDAPKPKRTSKKQNSKLRTVKPLEATWANVACCNRSPRDALGQE